MNVFEARASAFVTLFRLLRARSARRVLQLSAIVGYARPGAETMASLTDNAGSPLWAYLPMSLWFASFMILMPSSLSR